MNKFESETNLVLGIFKQIAKIPRKSDQEEKIIEYLVSWIKKEGFVYEKDKVGSILILIPATKGLEKAPGVILQGHMDMVCVGEPDPAVYGVRLKSIKENNTEWLTAINTSAGFDNGIGLAVSMALAKLKAPHGPLAVMATVAEETGLTGALEMSFKTPLKDYKYLLNFDSEDEGEATISSAGGGDSIISLPLEKTVVDGEQAIKIKVKGLMGGHSGVDIGEDRLNAIKVMVTVLSRINKELGLIRLVSLTAGMARNVIPFESEAVVLGISKLDELKRLVTKVKQEELLKSKNKKEKLFSISYSIVNEKIDKAMSVDASLKLVNLLLELPHGVVCWSKSVEGLVQTSTNLAVIHNDSKVLTIDMMTRSSVDSDISKVREAIKTIAKKYGASVEQSNVYSGWPAKLDNKINKVAKIEWKKLTGKNLRLIAVHAGLECGSIIGRYPHLEAISVGPTIKGAHSIEEKVEVESIGRFYNFAKGMIVALSKIR